MWPVRCGQYGDPRVTTWRLRPQNNPECATCDGMVIAPSADVEAAEAPAAGAGDASGADQLSLIMGPSTVTPLGSIFTELPPTVSVMEAVAEISTVVAWSL